MKERVYYEAVWWMIMFLKEKPRCPWLLQFSFGRRFMDTKHLVALISGYLLLNLYLKIYDASDVLPSSCIALPRTRLKISLKKMWFSKNQSTGVYLDNSHVRTPNFYTIDWLNAIGSRASRHTL